MHKTEYLELTPETARLIAGQEGREVEFKTKPEGIKCETFVAFANANGGTILSGVAESYGQNRKQEGVVVGCDISDQTKQRLINMASSCTPTIDIMMRIENLATNKPIIRIDIAPGTDKPYATASGLYKIRSDGQNLAVDPSLMKAIVFEQETETFVERFQAAAMGVMQQMNDMHLALTKQIERVEHASNEARKAAHHAKFAAQEAEAAAIESIRAIKYQRHKPKPVFETVVLTATKGN